MSLTSAVSRDGFSFSGEDLYAAANGDNRHRRASIAELGAHFDRVDEVKTAHWYEAQLIHYGVKPSKTRAVAQMRLFDAFRAGNLTVPVHVQKLERDLKKEWIQKDREAKQAGKSVAGGSSRAAAGKKRKADGSTASASTNLEVTININGAATTISAESQSSTAATGVGRAPAAKKAKTTTASKAKVGTPGAKLMKANDTKSKTAAGKKPTVGSSISSRTAPATASKTKQTARRGGTSSAARGRIASSASKQRVSGEDDENYGLDDPPPPYSEFDLYHDDRAEYDDLSDRNYDSRDDQDSYSDERRSQSDSDDDGDKFPPLGLLNGGYELECPYVTNNWGHGNFSLVLTLQGDSLWGSFDLGPIHGILRIEERPWSSSEKTVPFIWRGEEVDGPMMNGTYGNEHEGYLVFLGAGRIDGWIDWRNMDFGGKRLSGQGSRSEIDARTMENEFLDYNEEVYERQNRARWR